MEQMNTLTVNGEQYEVADAAARTALENVDTALDGILAIQEALIGGESA